MDKLIWITGATLLTAGGISSAAEYGEKPDTPQLPGVPYVVHDGTRPQPRVVESGGAVSVKPPSDAIVLFDGKNLDAWKGNWKVRPDGVLVADGSDLETKQSFGPIQLHLEWKVPAGREVRGQGGGNSGIFLMGLYEMQVLQSNGNKTYPDGQAGALYGQRPPLVNATAPQGEWQSYDIVFTPPVYEGEKVETPAKITVFHNGVLVQHDQPYLGPTQHLNLASYPKSHPKTGPIRLQFHGDPIEYRNIWLRPVGGYDEKDK